MNQPARNYGKDLYMVEWSQNARPTLLCIPDAALLPLLNQEFKCTIRPARVPAFSERLKWMGTSAPSCTEMRDTYSNIEALLEQGVDTVKALIKAGRLATNLLIQRALFIVAIEAFNGASITSAAALCPEVFGLVARGQIAAGEQVADLAAAFRELYKAADTEGKIRSQATSAAIYPIALFVILYGVLGYILYTVFPELAKSFRSLHVELNSFTQALVTFSLSLKAHPWLLGVPAVCAIGLYAFRGIILPAFRVVLQHTPFFSSYYALGQITTFTAVLASQLRNKRPIIQCVSVLENISEDRSLRARTGQVRSNLEGGMGICMAFTPVIEYFGKIAIPFEAALEVGSSNQTGGSGAGLAQSVSRASDQYLARYIRATEIITKLMEPAMLIVVGGVVGVVISAAYYPILTASQHIK